MAMTRQTATDIIDSFTDNETRPFDYDDGGELVITRYAHDDWSIHLFPSGASTSTPTTMYDGISHDDAINVLLDHQQTFDENA